MAMSKVIFILHRKSGTTREECLERWIGRQHTSVVSTIPGLTRWVQNHVTPSAGQPACDGVGELWFENDQAMQNALGSHEMVAAVEDAKNFLDMERTGLVIVTERTVIGQAERDA